MEGGTIVKSEKMSEAAGLQHVEQHQPHEVAQTRDGGDGPEPDDAHPAVPARPEPSAGRPAGAAPPAEDGHQAAAAGPAPDYSAPDAGEPGPAQPADAPEACLPAAGDGAAACAEQLELLGMLLASPCPSSSIPQAPERLRLPLPRDGFMCDQCGDRFVLPSSLEEHQTRRSLRTTFDCPHCRHTVVFHNKCQLLEHMDLHKIDPVSIDPALIDTAALTPAELGCLTPVSADDTAADVVPGKTKTTQIDKVNRPVHVSCPMCNTLCSTVTLSEHLCPPPEPDADALPTLPLRCPDCDQPCPSECALLAHQGLHKPDLWPYPYVCPECGLKVLGTHDQCLEHVVSACLHLTRDLKACCALCRVEVSDAKPHMLQKHVQKLYKCRRCPLAFESINGFSGHVVDKHGGDVAAGEAAYMLILKCPFCAATFNNANTLRDHMGSRKHGERVLQMVRFVFRCPECELDFPQKNALGEHLTQRHPEFKMESMLAQHRPPPAAPPPPPPPPVRVLGRPPKHTRQLTGAEPPPPPPPAGRRQLPAPLLTPHGRLGKVVVHACIVCKEEFRRKPEYTEHARLHLREGVPLCLLCNTRFASKKMLRNHLADHASEIGRDRCGLCYAKLGNRESLQFHLEGEHDLYTFACPSCELLFERQIDLNRHNFAKHRGGRGRGGADQERGEDAEGEDEDADDPPAGGGERGVRRRRSELPAEQLGRYRLEEAGADEPPAERAAKRARAAPADDEPAETLEEIASFVAGGGRAAQFELTEEEADGGDDEVIELEMKEGEIMQKQLSADTGGGQEAGPAAAADPDGAADASVAAAADAAPQP